MQAYGLNRSLNPAGTLSTLLQGGIKTIPPSQPKSSVSGIKGKFKLEHEFIKLFIGF